MVVDDDGDGEPDLPDGEAEALLVDELDAFDELDGFGEALGEPVGSPPAITATSLIAMPGDVPLLT